MEVVAAAQIVLREDMADARDEAQNALDLHYLRLGRHSAAHFLSDSLLTFDLLAFEQASAGEPLQASE